MNNLFTIFIGIVLINNIILSYFLGICPFIGVSNKLSSAFSMGMATTFVMTLTAIITWAINHWIIIKFNVPFLQYVAFIIVIATLVQFVEMFMKKTSPLLHRTLGIYLPLITTNCAVLGLALIGVLKNYNFIENLVFGFGTGIGFTLSLIIMSGIREELEFTDVPIALKGAPITLIIAGILALVFMGFSGLIKV